MCTNYKVISGAGVLLGLIALFAIGELRPATHKWEVLSPTIPTVISTGTAHINTVYYVLRQTHEPVLRKDDGQNYTSKMLKVWRHDLGYENYTFCPRSDLFFQKNVPFTPEMFYTHISHITQNYEKIYELRAAEGCVVVSFSKPHKSYLDFLTLYENAPTLSAASGLETGLGSFYVKSADRERIVLSRKKMVRGGYSEICLWLYRGVGDPLLQNKGISDFNLISDVDVPEWVKQDYIGFDNVELKSANLIINHPDLAARKLIRNCLDVDMFRRAYLPMQKNFINLQTILPIGMRGAQSGFPVQNCSRSMFNVHLSTPITYLNNRNDNSAQLHKVAEIFKRRTGIPFAIVKYPREQVAAIKRQRPRPFNLTVVVIDAVMSNYEAFFGPFLDSSGYHDFNDALLRKLYGELVRTDEEESKLGIVRKMIVELDRQGVVLPLYQIKGRLYYPKGLKNFEVGKGFLEYPEVADFRW